MFVETRSHWFSPIKYPIGSETKIPLEQNRPHLSETDSPTLCEPPRLIPSLVFFFFFCFSLLSSQPDFGKQSRSEQERWKCFGYLTPYWPLNHASCEAQLKKKKMLPFFSSHPLTNCLFLFPTITEGKQSKALVFP